MNTIQQYPNLQILPLDNIRLHEHHDPQRTPPLIERLTSCRVLHNPPLVAEIPELAGQYMVLDGANRITSLKQMDFPHAIVQVVDPTSPGVILHTWNHVLWDLPPEDLLPLIQKIAGIEILVEDRSQSAFDPEDIAIIQLATGKNYRVQAHNQVPRTAFLNEIVNKYKSRARFDRTQIDDVALLKGLYTNLTGLVIYPEFSIREVIQNCLKDNLLPAGVTRFIVSPRALRINYPLDELDSDRPLEEKRQRLQDFILHRMNNKGVRVYTETTVMYDE